MKTEIPMIAPDFAPPLTSSILLGATDISVAPVVVTPPLDTFSPDTEISDTSVRCA